MIILYTLQIDAIAYYFEITIVTVQHEYESMRAKALSASQANEAASYSNSLSPRSHPTHEVKALRAELAAVKKSKAQLQQVCTAP
jgi:hypothetical protein